MLHTPWAWIQWPGSTCSYSYIWWRASSWPGSSQENCRRRQRSHLSVFLWWVLIPANRNISSRLYSFHSCSWRNGELYTRPCRRLLRRRRACSRAWAYASSRTSPWAGWRSRLPWSHASAYERHYAGRRSSQSQPSAPPTWLWSWPRHPLTWP